MSNFKGRFVVNNSKSKNTKKSATNFKLTPLQPCVAGIDIGASSIFVCAGFADGHQEVQEYLTFTEDLKQMAKWLKQCGIKNVAMESTGVYWIPVYDILAQEGFNVTLTNPRHLKTVPGRKTDVKDCQWIQQLHAYGLLQGSFRPDDEEVAFRGYVRQRAKLIELAAQQVLLMHKGLTQMNIQLNHVISHITGVTGMSIIRDIVQGERDPKVLAEYRNPRCKKSKEEIEKALTGNYREENLLGIKQALESYDLFHKQVAECDQAIGKILKRWEGQDEIPDDANKEDQKNPEQPIQKSYNLVASDSETAQDLKSVLGVDLTDIPGLDVNGVVKIIGEIGRDMAKWPTAKHFASWLGLCPGNKVSGGRILSSKTKPSANRVAQALRLAAYSLYRSRSALGAYYRKIRGRLGSPKAITATAHKLARILYNMLKEKKSFIEIGQEAYEQAYKEKQVKTLRKKAKELGFELAAVAG
jgi:transposase